MWLDSSPWSWTLLVWAGAGGFLLGLFFYGGLWWTLQRLQTTEQPGLLIFVSFMVRTAVTVILLYYLTQAQPLRLAVAMVAFIVARIVLSRRLGPLTRSRGT